MKKKTPFLVPSERSLSHAAATRQSNPTTAATTTNSSDAKGPARKTVTGNLEQQQVTTASKKRKNTTTSKSNTTKQRKETQEEENGDVPIAKKTRSAMKKKNKEIPSSIGHEIDLSNLSDEEFQFQSETNTTTSSQHKSPPKKKQKGIIYTKKPKIEETEEKTTTNIDTSSSISPLSIPSTTPPHSSTTPLLLHPSPSTTSPITHFQPSTAHFFTMPPPPTILFLRVQLIDILDSIEEILEQTIIKVDMNIESTKQLNYLIEESSSRFESHSVSNGNTLYYFLNDGNSELRKSFSSVQKMIITTQHAYEDFLDYIRCKLRQEEYNLYFKN